MAANRMAEDHPSVKNSYSEDGFLIKSIARPESAKQSKAIAASRLDAPTPFSDADKKSDNTLDDLSEGQPRDFHVDNDLFQI